MISELFQISINLQYCKLRIQVNGIDNAVVVISWPKEAYKKPKALKAFICTDVSLSTVTILEYYSNRWCIETFFSQAKDSLGFAKYQIRSIKGIERLWTLMSLFHLLCTTGLGKVMPFGEGIRLLRKSIQEERITFIYQCAQQGVPLEDLHTACA
jgi:transposase